MHKCTSTDEQLLNYVRQYCGEVGDEGPVPGDFMSFDEFLSRTTIEYQFCYFLLSLSIGNVVTVS